MKPTIHAKERLMQRYGMTLTTEQNNQIIDDIHENKAVFINYGHEKYLRFFVVFLDNKAIPVLYSKKTKSIVTVYHRKTILTMLNHRLFSLKQKAHEPKTNKTGQKVLQGDGV